MNWNDAVIFSFPKSDPELFHAHFREHIEEIEKQHNHIGIIRKDHDSFTAAATHMWYDTFICLLYIRAQVVLYRRLVTVYFYTVLETISICNIATHYDFTIILNCLFETFSTSNLNVSLVF